MGAIFQNAHLTLSATSAKKNSKKGFLHPRRPRFHPPTLRHSPTSPSLTRALVLRPWLQTWAASVDGPASPLSGRGWAAGAAAGAADTAFRARAAVLGVP